MRTVFVLAILLLTFNTTTYGMGLWGTYFISGTAYSANNTVLKNKTLTVKLGREMKTVVTDTNGHFEIEIDWETACPSGLTPAQRARATRRMNPEFIIIHYVNKTIKLENKWKKYVGVSSEPKEKITWNKDLYFS